MNVRYKVQSAAVSKTLYRKSFRTEDSDRLAPCSLRWRLHVFTPNVHNALYMSFVHNALSNSTDGASLPKSRSAHAECLRAVAMASLATGMR